MTEHTGPMPTPEHEAAIQQALRGIADSAPTAAQAGANFQANMPALREALGGVPMLGSAALETPPPVCHRCGTPASTQWQRNATPAEAGQHWAAQEQHIRSIPDIAGNRNAEYTADRTQPVTKAVHGCDEHVVDAPHATHDADCGGHGACGCLADPS